MPASSFLAIRRRDASGAARAWVARGPLLRRRALADGSTIRHRVAARLAGGYRRSGLVRPARTGGGRGLAALPAVTAERGAAATAGGGRAGPRFPLVADLPRGSGARPARRDVAGDGRRAAQRSAIQVRREWRRGSRRAARRAASLSLSPYACLRRPAAGLDAAGQGNAQPAEGSCLACGGDHRGVDPQGPDA